MDLLVSGYPVRLQDGEWLSADAPRYVLELLRTAPPRPGWEPNRDWSLARWARDNLPVEIILLTPEPTGPDESPDGVTY